MILFLKNDGHNVQNVENLKCYRMTLIDKWKEISMDDRWKNDTHYENLKFEILIPCNESLLMNKNSDDIESGISMP